MSNTLIMEATTGKTNKIMTYLTYFSAIMLPLGVIAGMYGMNIRLPFQDDWYAFIIVCCTMTVIATVMYLFFKHKKWF